MYIEKIILGLLLAINLVSFLIMAHDKRQSRKGGNTERVSEGMIFFMAAIFGSVGVYASMLVFRHKTKKWYFQLGIPLLIIQNLATVYLVREFVTVFGE